MHTTLLLTHCAVCCVLQAYGHFARGTGSLLATVADPAEVDARWQLVGGSGSLELRGYTPPAQRLQVGAELSSSSGAAAKQQDTAGSVDGTQGSAVVSETGGSLAAVAGGVGDDSYEESASLVAAWRQLGLRYFTVREIAQLHSFPDRFSLPAGFTSRQGYQLLGNSLSVAVVADLIAYLTLSAVGQNAVCQDAVRLP